MSFPKNVHIEYQHFNTTIIYFSLSLLRLPATCSGLTPWLFKNDAGEKTEVRKLQNMIIKLDTNKSLPIEQYAAPLQATSLERQRTREILYIYIIWRERERVERDTSRVGHWHICFLLKIQII